jgi:tetratricopeptide (TPR) repeat protein
MKAAPSSSPVPQPADTDPCAAAGELVQRSNEALEQGQAARARDLAAQAVALARGYRGSHDLARSLLALARAEFASGHRQESFRWAVDAHDLLRAHNDLPLQLRALNVIALVHAESLDTSRAVELFQQGLQIAVGPSYSASRCALLHNLGRELINNNEYAEALRSYDEAAALAKEFPQRQGQWQVYASELAHVHARYADHLRRRGQLQQAALHFQAASQALPALDLRGWRSFSGLERLGLSPRVEALSLLGRWAEARAAAATYIRASRAQGRDSRSDNTSRMLLADLYWRQGNWVQALRHAQCALAISRRINDPRIARDGLELLSKLYAITGAHERALALRKELAAQRSRQRQEGGALRCRLAAIERQAERRRRQAEEAQVHAQRLAIIGRLIAQTHHALSAPIAHARFLAAQALASATQPDKLRPLLGELNQAIDLAAALVSQLKLFSYRSSPQPMALSLHESLLDAWRGLASHINSGGADLHISGHTQLQVWGDAQRLGIMLKVLLIELTQRFGAGAEPLQIGAHIEAGEAHTVLLHIETRGGSAADDAAAAPASLGAALCMEIAGEMGGDLHLTPHADALVRYCLRLREATGSACDMPWGPARQTLRQEPGP